MTAAYPTVLGMDILRLRAERLAELTGVDLSTARRWKRRQRVPEPVRRLLSLLVLGELDAFGWTGWRLLEGSLVSPEGWTSSAGQVLTLPLLLQQIAALDTECRRWRNREPQPDTQGDELEHLKRRIAALRA